MSNEEKWREDFEDDLGGVYGLGRFSRMDEGYETEKLNILWRGYRVGRQHSEKEIESLRAELNESISFHCPHYKTTNNGYVACELKYPESMVNTNILLKQEQEILELKKLIIEARLWIEKEYVPDIDIDSGQHSDWLEKTKNIKGALE